MGVFPGDYASKPVVISRSTTMPCDDTQTPGNITPAQILGLIVLEDFYPKLLTADDVINDIAANITDLTIALSGAGSHKNKLNQFLCTADCTVRLPAGATRGATIPWIQMGNGILSFVTVAGANQTIINKTGKRSNGVESSGALTYLGDNKWLLRGEVQA